jgi:hypothetical protein
LSRGVLGGDAGELQFVPPILGLTHPTGYPFQVLFHFVWSQLPIGTVAFRLNLLDAILAAVAVGLVVAVVRQSGAGPGASILAGLSLAFGELWWSQAVRGDKYTLNGLFLALVLLLFLRWRARPDPARTMLLALVYGLSLTHHRSMLLIAPALAGGFFLSGWRQIPVRTLAISALLFAAPLVLYVYVPWAGSRGLPPGSWPVGTPAEFFEFLLDRGYTSQLRLDAVFGGRLAEEAGVLLRSFGPLGAGLGLIGLVASFVRDWRFSLVLVLSFVPQAVVGASYLLESNYQLPRHWVFFLPGFLIWSIWLGYGVDAGLSFVRDWIRRSSPEPLTPRPPLPRTGEGGQITGESWQRSSRIHVTPVLPLSRARERGPGGEGSAGRSSHPFSFVGALCIALCLVMAGTAWWRGAVMLVRSEAGAETMDAWRQDFQRSPVAERFGRLAMDLAAPDSMIVADWEQATVLWYFQRVEGRRPDLTIRYPIERIDETLTEARASGRTVYITRTLPGIESRGVTSSVGPLLQVFPPPVEVAHSDGAIERFQGGLTLVRAEIHDRALRPGSVVPLTLHWLAEQHLPEAYAVSVRLIGPDGSVLAAQDERHPALGTSPTDRWPVNQIVGDYRELPLGSLIRPGDYHIQVVPYRVDPPAGISITLSSVPFSVPIQIGPRSPDSLLDVPLWLVGR